MRTHAARATLAAPLLLTLIACGPGGRSPAETELVEGPILAFENVIVADPVNGMRGPVTVVILGDRIVSVEESGGPAIASRVERVDASGRYLLPGLWDLHTHLAHADEGAPPLLVTQGVTGVRDLGGKLDEIDALRARIDGGAVLGPRIVRSGPTLNGAPNAPHHRVIESADAARAAVAELKAAGVDLLKTHNATSREAYFALLEAAHSADLTVAGHVPTAVDPKEACAAGQASIEHIATLFEGTYIAGFASEMDAFLGMSAWLETDAPALVECFAEHRTLFVPTLRAYELRAHWAAAWDNPDPRWRYASPVTYRQWRADAEPTEIDRRPQVIQLRQSLVDAGIEVVRQLHQAGAPIGAGTDLPSPGLLPGFDLHAEIRLLARAGLSPRGALRAATRGPGADAGGDALQGEVVAGAPADLLLVSADPFADLAALETIEGVVVRGSYLDRAALDEVLASLETPLDGIHGRPDADG